MVFPVITPALVLFLKSILFPAACRLSAGSLTLGPHLVSMHSYACYNSSHSVILRFDGDQHKGACKAWQIVTSSLAVRVLLALI